MHKNKENRNMDGMNKEKCRKRKKCKFRKEKQKWGKKKKIFK